MHRLEIIMGLERSFLWFCGFSPIRVTLIGLLENRNSRSRERCLARIGALAGKRPETPARSPAPRRQGAAGYPSQPGLIPAGWLSLMA